MTPPPPPPPDDAGAGAGAGSGTASIVNGDMPSVPTLPAASVTESEQELYEPTASAAKVSVVVPTPTLDVAAVHAPLNASAPASVEVKLYSGVVSVEVAIAALSESAGAAVSSVNVRVVVAPVLLYASVALTAKV